jgi:Xaa-Pro aminopeptidase
VLADLLSGPRCAQVGAPPTPRRLRREDLVLCDLAPRHGGLWGDSCATWAVADPTPAGQQLHGAALSALAAARAALVPGARAGDVDEAARTVMRDAGFEYPHHTGHGIGFSAHEEPRIIPGGERVLEAGMTVALEPGGYRDGIGVRVEQVFVVTEGPPRLLSGHDLALRDLRRVLTR